MDETNETNEKYRAKENDDRGSYSLHRDSPACNRFIPCCNKVDPPNLRDMKKRRTRITIIAITAVIEVSIIVAMIQFVAAMY